MLSSISDYLLWYAKDISLVKYRQLYYPKFVGGDGSEQYSWIEMPDGSRRRSTEDERNEIPRGRFFRPDVITSQRPARRKATCGLSN